MATTYPNEAWPTDSQIEALDGTTDQETGLPYIAAGTAPTSSPTLEVQFNRKEQRLKKIVTPWRQLQVVDEGALKIGIYPGWYTLGGQRKFFEGTTAVSVPTGVTRYVYIDSANAAQIASSEPMDLTSFVPLAKLDTTGGIVAITDLRHEAAMHIPQVESTADISGTPNAMFQIDDDNTGPKLKNNAGKLQVRNEADTDDADLSCGMLDAIDAVQINSGPQFKESSGEVQLRNAGDTDDADLKCGTLNAIDAVQINTSSTIRESGGELAVRTAADDDDANFRCGTLNAVDGVQVNGTSALNASAEAMAVADGAVSAAKLDATLQDSIPTCTMQVGGETSDNIDVTVQLKDANGNNLSAETLVRLWVGDSAKGGECATAPSGGISVQTGTLLNTVTAGKHVLVISDTNGVVVLRLTDTGTPTYYLMAEFDGKIVASAAITFA